MPQPPAQIAAKRAARNGAAPVVFRPAGDDPTVRLPRVGEGVQYVPDPGESWAALVTDVNPNNPLVVHLTVFPRPGIVQPTPQGPAPMVASQAGTVPHRSLAADLGNYWRWPGEGA